ncbi:MAG: HAD-IA family hydrolase [Phycisphaerales bacterium]|nr:HAD-IA family hydrolase [Phycisphaerales bacterium]
MTDRICVVCFDLDGTLIDASEDLAWSVNEVMAALGRPQHSIETVASYLGNGMPRLVHRALMGSMHEDAPEDLHAEAVQQFRRAYAACGHVRTRVLDGAGACLEMLRCRGVHTAITTNKPQSALEHVMDALGAQLPVDGLYGGDHVWPRKPDPTMLKEAQRLGGGGPMVLVGDSVTDRDAATAAGVPFLAVRGGFNHGIPIDDCLEADALVFDDLHGVQEWLERHT